jgi:benzoyl-CoA reductase/2-hydroxyglutaryl-CoA dehydratase subunit BcrC/BadD/HgdB
MGRSAAGDPVAVCRDRLGSILTDLRSFRDGGGKVMGTLCHAFPPAAGAGLGMWPVRVLHGATQEMECAGEKHVRPDVCPLVKSFLGSVSTGTGLHSLVDLWVGMYTCDQTRRLFQELGRLTGAEVQHIQMPATRTPAAEEFFTSQAERLVAGMASRLGTAYDAGAASCYEEDRFEAAATLDRLVAGGRLSPVLVHLLYQILHVGLPGGLARFFEDTAAMSPKPSSRIRIAVTGGPMPLEDDCIPLLLEEYGAAMIPLGCSGRQTAAPDGRGCGGSAGCLAGEYFRKSRCARSRPNDAMFEDLGRGIAETGCRGLIVKTLKFCDIWFTEKERLKRMMPVPVLVIDTSFAPGERERLRTRVEAFMESLS